MTITEQSGVSWVELYLTASGHPLYLIYVSNDGSL